MTSGRGFGRPQGEDKGFNLTLQGIHFNLANNIGMVESFENEGKAKPGRAV